MSILEFLIKNWTGYSPFTKNFCCQAKLLFLSKKNCPTESKHNDPKRVATRAGTPNPKGINLTNLWIYGSGRLWIADC